MSLISDLMQMVASLTTRLNEIGANSKRTEEMPLMNPIDRSSLIRLSKNGLSYKTPFQGLIDELGVEDGVIQIGELEIVPDGAGGESLKIPEMPNPIWRIQGQEYTKDTETLIPIPYAATEKYRTDIIVGNTSNGFDRLEGVEGDNIGIPPSVPNGTVEITRLNIFGNQIGAPSLPSMNGFITKTSKKYRAYDFRQPDPQSLFLSSNTTTHLIRRLDLPTNTKICSGFITAGILTPISERHYDGMDVFVKALSNEPITLTHDDQNVDVPFWFTDGQDLEIKRHEIVHLKYNKAGNRVELVGVAPYAFRVLERVDTGTGFGIRRVGNTADVGLDSVNLSLEWSEASGEGSTIGGGWGNRSSGRGSTIGGGSSNLSSGTFSNIVGGWDNISSGRGSTIGGGSGNLSSGEASTIVGGDSNIAPSYGEIASGTFNEEYTPMSATEHDEDDIAWSIGNGISGLRSNLLTLFKSGVMLIKNLTISKIDAETTGKVLVNKEWVLDKIGAGGGLTTLETAATAITLIPAHKNQMIATTASTSVTVTVTEQVAGDYFQFLQFGDGQIAFSPDTGVTIATSDGNLLRTASIRSMVALYFVTDTYAVLTGERELR